MALQTYTPSAPAITQQFSPDDRSYRAQATRATKPPKTAWWFDSAGNRQTKVLEGDLAEATSVSSRNGKLVVSGPFGTREFDSAGSTTSTGTTGADAPPKFSLIPKDPEIDKAASAGLVSTQAKSAQADTLFGKYLAQFEQRANPALIDAEIGTYKNAASGLKSLLDAERANIKAAQDATTVQDILSARGASEGRLLGYNARAGGANLGTGGEETRIFSDSIARALIPARERLAMLGRDDALAVYNSTIANASRPREVNQSYLQLLGQQPGQLLSLGGQEGANLSNAVRLLDSNRFSWSPDPRLTNQLPTPVAGYSLPGIPNYGGVTTPVRQPSLIPYVGGVTGGGTGGGFTRRPVAQSPLSYLQPYERQAYLTAIQADEVARQQSAAGAGRGRAQMVQDARAIADENYFNQTGKNPSNDPYYNEELWRALYNEALGMGA